MTSINSSLNDSNIASLIELRVEEHISVILQASELISNFVTMVIPIIQLCLDRGGCIYWCGNGGSAADSQHLAAELIGRFIKERPPIRSHALTVDTSIITAVANDYSFEDVFARQISGHLTSDDVLFVLSTSGNSPNIVNALNSANNLNATTVALLGNDGGSASKLSNHSLIVPSQNTARIQEVHIFVGHLICDMLDQ